MTRKTARDFEILDYFFSLATFTSGFYPVYPDGINVYRKINKNICDPAGIVQLAHV